MSAQPQPRFGPPFFDVRVERWTCWRFLRWDPPPGLVRIDLDPPAAGPEAELTFGTASGVEPVDEDFLRAEVERITGQPVLAIRRRGARSEQQRRVLILEAPPSDEPIGNIYGQDVVQGSLSLFADADEVYVFRGDEANCVKHRDESLVFSPLVVTIQRREDEKARAIEPEAAGQPPGLHSGQRFEVTDTGHDGMPIELRMVGEYGRWPRIGEVLAPAPKET